MSESQRWFLLVSLTLAGVLAYVLAPVLTPFLIGATLAYIGDPLVDRLEARRLNRTGAVVLVFLILTLVGLVLLVGLVPMLHRQILLLAAKLPAYAEWLQTHGLPAFAAWIGMDVASFDPGALRTYAGEAGAMAAKFLGAITRSGLTIMGWLANVVLVPVVTFYLLRDWDLIVERVRELLPRRLEPTVVRLARDSDEVLGSFLRGQLLVMLALGVIYTTGLWVVGLELALLIGMVAGAVSFVPYLGFVVGIVAAGVAALMQFHEPVYLLYVMAVFGVGQAIEGMLLTPLLVGDRIGLHPVAVIFAVLAGGQLFGFFGVLLALPVAAVAMVLLRFTHDRYINSALYAHPEREVDPL